MTNIIQRCGHCGNTTSFTRAASGSQPMQITDQEHAMTKWTTWRVLLCSTCTQPTLERDVQEIPGPIGPQPARSLSPEMLYPLQRTARWRDVLPPTVYKLYTDVLSVEKHSARACATVVGVTLEAICQVEQAKGNSLSEQLNDLANSGRIPTIINQMAQLSFESILFAF